MSIDPTKEYGRIVRTRRKELGWSQEVLAEAALGNRDRKGYISQVEQGLLPNLSPATIEKISSALNLDQDVVASVFAPAVKNPVIVKNGIIKAQPVDLTVLPVSGKLKKIEDEGDQNRLDIAHYGLPGPNSLESQTFPRGPCGHLSELLVPQKHEDQSPLVVYASTSNGGSTVADIHQIGIRLGAVSRENPQIKLIESPLLGTGNGGLEIYEAVKALASGFISSRHPYAVLRLRSFTNSNVTEARRAIQDLGK